jgi:putative ABC transport system substrate-binding protein
MLPHAKRFAALVNGLNNANEPEIRDLQAAASALGLQLEVFRVSNDREIDSAFASLIEHRAQALIVVSGPLFRAQRAQLASLASRHRLPAIYAYRDDVAAGGLISYGQSGASSVIIIMGTYGGRIPKGEKAGDLRQRARRFGSAWSWAAGIPTNYQRQDRRADRQAGAVIEQAL